MMVVSEHNNSEIVCLGLNEIFHKGVVLKIEFTGIKAKVYEGFVER